MLVCVVIFAGCVCAPGDPLGGKIYTFSSGEKGIEKNPNLTQPATHQQPFQKPPETTTRNITVTDSNSVFSIGMPAGYREERQVTAQQPVDFWFEYLQSGMELRVNGQLVELPERWSGKIGYTQRVTSFSYTLKNGTGQSQSYNLRMVPSQTGASVQAVTTEKWIAP
jgi:hypothetical protein